MGLFSSASCDGPEDCSAVWYSDDVDLAEDSPHRANTLGQTMEYLTEYEDWAISHGKLLCPDHRPKCDACGGTDPDCASCEALIPPRETPGA